MYECCASGIIEIGYHLSVCVCVIVHTVSSALLTLGISLPRAGNRLCTFETCISYLAIGMVLGKSDICTQVFLCNWVVYWDPKPEPILPGHKACFVPVMHSAVYNVCICYHTFLLVQSSGTIQLLVKFLSAYVVVCPIISSYQWFIVRFCSYGPVVK